MTLVIVKSGASPCIVAVARGGVAEIRQAASRIESIRSVMFGVLATVKSQAS